MHGDQAVVGDFDSCHVMGKYIQLKGGTPGWAVEPEYDALAENDWYSFDRIKLWLGKKGFGNPQPDVKYDSTAKILGYSEGRRLRP
jgi:hypothetical protein